MRKCKTLSVIGNVGWLFATLALAAFLGIVMYYDMRDTWMVPFAVWTGVAGLVFLTLSAYSAYRLKALTKAQVASGSPAKSTDPKPA